MFYNYCCSIALTIVEIIPVAWLQSGDDSPGKSSPPPLIKLKQIDVERGGLLWSPFLSRLMPLLPGRGVSYQIQ